MDNIQIAKSEVAKDEFLQKLAELGLTVGQVKDALASMYTAVERYRERQYRTTKFSEVLEAMSPSPPRFG